MVVKLGSTCLITLDSWLQVEEEEAAKPFVPKKVTRKVKRNFAPVLMKINADDLLDSNMFQRFNKTVELIFDNMEDVNMAEFDEAEQSAKDGQVRSSPALLTFHNQGLLETKCVFNKRTIKVCVSCC